MMLRASSSDVYKRQLLTFAAIAKEIKQRGGMPECSVKLAAGLPLAGFGREKKPFREYLLRSSQPVCFKFEGIPYKITIEDVKLFPQGYSAIAIHPELIQNEPSVLLMDIGGWTVDLMPPPTTVRSCGESFLCQQLVRVLHLCPLDVYKRQKKHCT